MNFKNIFSSFFSVISSESASAKKKILLGCKDAGWNGTMNFSHSNWNADILAKNARKRIAFQVLWSPPNYAKFLEMQEKFTKNNVRVCWFVRKPPEEYYRHHYSKAIPVFEIFKSKKDIEVSLHCRDFSLESFVSLLLRGKVQHKEGSRAKYVRIAFYDTSCQKCGAKQHFYLITDFMGVCSVEVLFAESWTKERLSLQPEITRLVEDFRKKGEGRRIIMGKVKARPSTICKGKYFRSFGCYKCDVIFERYQLYHHDNFYTHQETGHSFWTTLNRNDIAEAEEHWCCATEKGEFCE